MTVMKGALADPHARTHILQVQELQPCMYESTSRHCDTVPPEINLQGEGSPRFMVSEVSTYALLTSVFLVLL